MKKIKEHLNLIICLALMCVLTGVMFFYIDKKEGFHEDEIFSYIASNSKYSNILLTFAQTDTMDAIIKDDNPIIAIKNLIYYTFINPEEYEEKFKEREATLSNSIWKTPEDATEALTIDSLSEVFDFFTVYWHTGRDVHPPLFYFAVHIMSSIFFNHFSKYIIFLVNLIFFIGTCIYLRKIMQRLNKPNLAIPVLILYGLSIGAISTVMFQRMYMMLTFFTVWFFYVNLKIYYEDFELSKKRKIEICACTILGFLTQYYFCIYAAVLAFIMIVLMIIKKDKSKIKTYVLQFIKSAIIGVIIFIPCIYHIFFSYVGINGTEGDYTYLQMLRYFIKKLFDSFSFSMTSGGIVFGILIILMIIQSVKNKENRKLFSLLIIPVIAYIFAVSWLSNIKSLRYIMNILPIVAIAVVLTIDNLFKNKKLSLIILVILTIVISIFGLLTNNVEFLYVGYNQYLEIAEEYKDDRFVLICQRYFNHDVDILEMQIYEETLVLEPQELDQLIDDEKLQEDDEFILSIKNWVGDIDEILNTVMENTGYTNYELLLCEGDAANCSVYKITK